MDALLKHLPEIALAAGLAWGSGLRLYATLFALGIAGWLGWIDLPSHLGLLAHPLVLWSSGFMALGLIILQIDCWWCLFTHDSPCKSVEYPAN